MKSIHLAAHLWIIGLLLISGCDSTITIDAGCDAEFNPANAGNFCAIKFTESDVVASESFSYEVAVDQHGRIRLDAVNGTVELRGQADATSVKVSGIRRVGSRDLPDAESHLADLEVRVEDRTDEVYIRTVQPKQSLGRKYVVDYTITLPHDLDALLNQVNGDMTVRNTIGNLSVDLVNGIIDCFSTLPQNGAMELTLTNGNISLGIPIATSADFSASVVNGRISMSNLVLEDRVSTPRSETGTLGNGEGTIELTVVNGNIAITGHG